MHGKCTTSERCAAEDHFGSTPPTLQAASLEEGGVWPAPDRAPVLPMDHDPPGLACVVEDADAEPVEHA